LAQVGDRGAGVELFGGVSGQADAGGLVRLLDQGYL